jgi:hypothetical protein
MVINFANPVCRASESGVPTANGATRIIQKKERKPFIVGFSTEMFDNRLEMRSTSR